MQVDETFNGHEVALRPGEMLEIRLAENASTGYRWSVSPESKRSWAKVVREREETMDAPNGPPGRPGVRHLFFDAVETGAAELEIHYLRPWEKDKAPARTFRLRIVVRPDSGR